MPYRTLTQAMQRFRAAPDSRHPALARVLRASAAVSEHKEDRAQKLIADLLDREPSDAPAERLAHLFARSLQARLQGDLSATGNLYQEETSPQDMLGAFQTLVGATPFVRFGYSVANSAILDSIARHEPVHLLDIGIGSGSQWYSLLDALAVRKCGKECLVHLTGVDVPAVGDDPAVRLRSVGDQLSQYAADLGIRLSFSPVASLAEDLDFRALVAPLQETHALAINAAFALHHLPPADNSEEAERNRDAILRRLRDLEPRILTMVEPDVEHNALPFYPRVAESMGHYLTVFDALQSRLTDHPRERTILENAFFGSEIRNIVIGEGRHRVERHERHASWHRRLRSAGFSPIRLDARADSPTKVLEMPTPFSVRSCLGARTLDWKGVSLLAASAWSPSRSHSN